MLIYTIEDKGSLIHTEELQATQSFSLMRRQEYKAISDDPSGNIRQGSRRSKANCARSSSIFRTNLLEINYAATVMDKKSDQGNIWEMRGLAKDFA